MLTARHTLIDIGIFMVGLSLGLAVLAASALTY